MLMLTNSFIVNSMQQSICNLLQLIKMLMYVDDWLVVPACSSVQDY